jgi:glutathione S-transferase
MAVCQYKAKNPFGQIPTIDDDGVVVTESGAILLYLARKSGKLIPRDLAGETQVLRWSVAALNTIEVPVLTLWFVGINGGNGTKAHDALRHWSEQRLKQLDGWLANRRFIATNEFTVADILMTHVLSAASTDQDLLKPYRNVLAYQKRCTERPAWKKTTDADFERVKAA